MTTTTRDTQTVIDAALLPPSLRDSMIATYRELSETNRMLGFSDIADRCHERAEALAYGGSLVLAGGEDAP